MGAKIIAYVASTLPIALLDKKLADWNVSEVILQGKTHLGSYVYLQKRHPTLKVTVLSASPVLSCIHLMAVLLLIKFSRVRLVFFHECCCPIFDLLVKIIKPNGDFYPQVTLNSFLPVDPAEVTLTKLQKVIRIIGLEACFQYYRGELDNNEGFFFIQAVRSYPITIIRHDIGESQDILAAIMMKCKPCVNKAKILLLCGRDIVDDLELKRIYSAVINEATALGFECFVKDHPAEQARLNFFHEKAHVIDPVIPFELLDDEFFLVIGVASTGLLHFSKRAISIINFFSFVDEATRIRRLAHLTTMQGGSDIQCPRNFSELQKILIRLSARD